MARRRVESMAENREKLIRAARHAFATQGFVAASMDELTATAGFTRGALYHAFGDKKGLLWAVVEQIDAEMVERLRHVRERATDVWHALLDESVAYIEMALEPEIQRIMLLDGPAVLGDPSRWPGQNACLQLTQGMIQSLIDDGIVKPVDPEAAARLLNGAALNAALWIAASEHPEAEMRKAVQAFLELSTGLLERDG